MNPKDGLYKQMNINVLLFVKRAEQECHRFSSLIGPIQDIADLVVP